MEIKEFEFEIKGPDRLKTICRNSPLNSNSENSVIKIGSHSCVNRCPRLMAIDFDKKSVVCK